MSTEYKKPSHLPEHPSDGIGTLVTEISGFSKQAEHCQVIEYPEIHPVAEASQGRSLHLSG
jgi:hypothetical protein